MALRAAVFDFDGVIVDSREPHYEWFRHVCSSFNKPFPFSDVQEFIDGYVQPSCPAMYISLGFDWEKEGDSVWEEYHAYPHKQGTLIPGITDALSSLRNHMLVSLASSNTREKVCSKLESFCISR